jgi:hypothetical protein
MPPEAPEEGQNSNLSNLLGAKFSENGYQYGLFWFRENRKYSPTLFNFVFQQAPFVFAI